AAAGAGDARRIDPVLLEERLGAAHRVGGALDRTASLGHRTPVRGPALVGLQAGKAQAGPLADLARQHRRRLARFDPAAAHADLELDIDVELRPGRGEVPDVLDVV